MYNVGMNRCVIIGGADIADYEFIRKYLKKTDFNIFCDSGLKHMEVLKLKADLIVGDFDSHKKPDVKDVEIIELPCIKDDTDTFFAVREAIERGFEDFLLIGVTGGRLDHTIGNLSILFMLDAMGKHAIMADDYSELEVVSDKATVSDEWGYFSILNIYGTAEGITIENAKYELSDAEISVEWQHGVCNEPLPGKKARISIKEGKLLLVRVRKEADNKINVQ